MCWKIDTWCLFNKKTESYRWKWLPSEQQKKTLVHRDGPQNHQYTSTTQAKKRTKIGWFFGGRSDFMSTEQEPIKGFLVESPKRGFFLYSSLVSPPDPKITKKWVW